LLQLQWSERAVLVAELDKGRCNDGNLVGHALHISRVVLANKLFHFAERFVAKCRDFFGGGSLRPYAMGVMSR